jgi:hypothetical protein
MLDNVFGLFRLLRQFLAVHRDQVEAWLDDAGRGSRACRA